MNLLATSTGRKVLFAGLYLSEGAPIGFIWWALPTQLRASGVAVDRIAMLSSLLVLPWTFKFLWAPLVDILRGTRWTLKSWILAAQLVMGLTLWPLILLDLQHQFQLLVGLLLLHALAAATQDVAVDALCISTVERSERGRMNGWMQAGMLVGRALLGGGSLILARRLGQSGILLLLLACVWLPMLMVWLFCRVPAVKDRDRPHVAAQRRQFLAELRRALAGRVTWLALIFAASAGAAYEAVGAVAGTLLIDQQWTQEQVGWFFAFPVILCMVAGSLAGGWLADRFERRRWVATTLLMLILAVAGLAAITASSSEALRIPLPIAWLLAAIYLGIGLFVAASYSLFMDITSGPIAATQFSAFMGATNGCEAFAAFATALLFPIWGYAGAFLAMCSVSLLALLLLPWLRSE